MQFRGTPYSWDDRNVRDDWQRVIGGTLDIQPVSGLHHEILDEPHVGVLAEKLAAALDSRQGRKTPAAT